MVTQTSHISLVCQVYIRKRNVKLHYTLNKFYEKTPYSNHYEILTKNTPKYILRICLEPTGSFLACCWGYTNAGHLNLLDQIKGSQPPLILPLPARPWPPLKHRWVDTQIGETQSMCLSSLLHTVLKKPLPMRGYYIDSMCMLWLFWSNLANKAISNVKCSHFCCTHISWILFQNRIWSLNLPPPRLRDKS